MNGVSIPMAATSLTMLCLASDPETNLLISRCSFIFALLISPDPEVSLRSEQAQQRRFERRHNKERMRRRRS